jgi:uncharacterized protein (DUF305 family)
MLSPFQRYIGAAMFPAILVLAPIHASGQQAAKNDKSSSPSMQMHQQMMKGSKESMAMKPTGDMDRDFARMMRHHHQMGIQMAEQEMQNGKDPQMKDMARKIAETQKDEVKQFDEWMKGRGASGKGDSAKK